MLAGLADVYGYEKKRNRKRKEQNYSNFGALLDQFWSHLGPFGPSWAYLGTLFGLVWRYLGLVEAILGNLGAVLSHLGAVLRPSWGILGPSWAILGASWGQELFRTLRPDLPVG